MPDPTQDQVPAAGAPPAPAATDDSTPTPVPSPAGGSVVLRDRATGQSYTVRYQGAPPNDRELQRVAYLLAQDNPVKAGSAPVKLLAGLPGMAAAHPVPDTAPLSLGDMLGGPDFRVPGSLSPVSASGDTVPDWKGTTYAPIVGQHIFRPDGSEVGVTDLANQTSLTNSAPPFAVKDTAELGPIPAGQAAVPLPPARHGAPMPSTGFQSFLDRLNETMKNAVENPPREAFAGTPGVSELAAAGRVLSTPAQAVEGAVSAGLGATDTGQYSDSVLGNAGQVAKEVITSYGGLAAAGRAVATGQGQEQIAQNVPTLGVNTPAGLAYGVGVGAGLDPLNFVGAGEVGDVGKIVSALGGAAKEKIAGALGKAAGNAAVPASTTVSGGSGAAAGESLGGVAPLTVEAPSGFEPNYDMESVDPATGEISEVRRDARGVPIPANPAGPGMFGSSAPDMYRAATYTDRAGRQVDVYPGIRPPSGGKVLGEVAGPGMYAPAGFDGSVIPMPAQGGALRPGVADRVGQAVAGGVSTVKAAGDRLAQAAPGLAKAVKFGADVWNVPKTLKIAGDFSAPLRQAGLLTAGRPRLALQAAGQSLRTMASRPAYDSFVRGLESSPLAADREAAGLYLSTRYGGADASLGAREEAFASRMLGRLPVVAGTERGYRVYLDSLRANSFDQGLAAMKRSVELGALSPPDYQKGARAYASYINAASGRGSLGALEPAANVLAGTMFSPRAFAARLQVLPAMAKLPGPARRQAARDLLSYVGAGVGALGVARAAGAHVDLDPTSSTFGAYQMPGSRVVVDPWGGYGSIARVVIQEAMGRRTTASGYQKPLDGSGKHPENRLSNAGRYMEEQGDPAARLLLNGLRGARNEWGMTETGKDMAAETLAPIVLQSIRSAVKADGFKGLRYVPAAVLGVGLRDTSRDVPPRSSPAPVQAAPADNPYIGKML